MFLRKLKKYLYLRSLNFVHVFPNICCQGGNCVHRQRRNKWNNQCLAPRCVSFSSFSHWSLPPTINVSIKIKRTSNLVFSHIPLPEFIWSVDWFCACTMYIFINILFTTEIPQGPYKAHWVTEGNVMSYSKDIACIDVQRRYRWWWKWWSQWSCCFRHDPPLLYNVEADPQELYRLTPGTFADYDQVIITTSPFAFDLNHHHHHKCHHRLWWWWRRVVNLWKWEERFCGWNQWPGREGRRGCLAASISLVMIPMVVRIMPWCHAYHHDHSQGEGRGGE